MTATAETTSGSSSGPPSPLCRPTTVLGRTEPRLFTPPLVAGPPGLCGCGCALSESTSDGFKVVRFARDVLGAPLDPWQRWLAIHGLELLPDGRPRFRKLLVIVARQNGKTHLLVVLALYWLFVAKVALVLGTSTNLEYARESWDKAAELAEGNAALSELMPRNAVRRGNNSPHIRTKYKTRYKIAASNERGGRSLTVGRLILDELREHHDWSAWSASYNAMNAVRNAQAWGITNQGSAQAVVLRSLRSEAIDKHDQVRPADERDPRIGVFEWSAPRGSRPDDPEAIAAANPNVGRRIDTDDLISEARSAMRAGEDQLAEFMTEVLCMPVDALDPAVDLAKWQNECLVPGSLDGLRSGVAAVFDVSLDGQRATLYAAAKQDDGRVRVDVVKDWHSTAELRRELPGLVRRIRPRSFGWLPNGPAAAVTAELAKQPGWPPRGVTLQEITSDTPAVCMGLAELIDSGDVVHSGDPLLDAQLQAAERKWTRDRWVFTRRGSGHVDAVYAAAAAVHLARTMPPPRRRQLVVAEDTSDT